MAPISPPSRVWTHPSYPRYSLHPMSIPMFEALLASDLRTASSFAPDQLSLPPFMIEPISRWVWKLRVDAAAADPDQLPWITRLIVYEADGEEEPGSTVPEKKEQVVVGRIGFHGKPDDRGMVEVGYEISSEHQRKGHARVAFRMVIDIARRTDGVKFIRGSVLEKNIGSRKVIEGEGLKKVGREFHEGWGLEDIFEMDVSSESS